MGPEVLMGITFFITFFGMIFGVSYMRNKENMALIEKGINPRSAKVSPKPFISLKHGLLLCGAGLGLFLAFMIDQFMLNHKGVLTGGETYERDFPQIYFALIALFGGLGLVTSYRIEKRDWLDKNTEE